jgi:uncharacterized protein (DUF433 family)
VAVSFEIVPRARPPFRRSPDIHGGQPVFAGTTIPLQVLLESLRRGDGVARLLEGYPELTEAQVRAVLSWALEELIGRERLPVGPPQASLLPRVKDGIITNTGELRRKVMEKAVCPAAPLGCVARGNARGAPGGSSRGRRAAKAEFQRGRCRSEKRSTGRRADRAEEPR